MKSLCTVLFTLLLVSVTSAQQWEQVASLPLSASKHHPVTFALNGIGYSFVGSNTDENPTDEGYKYDPATDTWTEIASFPGISRGFSYGVQDGDYAYMGFGLNTLNGQFLNDLWKFDPNTETWEELASCPCLERSHPAFIHVDGKIFIGGGSSLQGNRKDWWEYDIATDSWDQKDDIPGAPRHHPFYFDLDGFAYVGFGHGDGIFNDFYRYDPISESWALLDDFPGEARVAGTQFTHDGNGYILSGDGDDHDYMETGEFWKYDADTDSWEQLPSHPGLSKWAPGSFVIDGIVYLAQGQNRYLNQFPGYELTNEVLAFDLDLYNSPFSIGENEGESSISIYPNPAENVIMVTSNQSTTEATSFKIFSALGKEVFSQSSLERGQPIDISTLANGTYTIQVLTDKNIATTKFIKR